MQLTNALTLCPDGRFELAGQPISKADAVNHYAEVGDAVYVPWPLATEADILQGQIDALETEKAPLDEVLAKAAERARAARQAHRAAFEEENNAIKAAEIELAARKENHRRNVAPAQSYDSAEMGASTREASITAEVERLSGELQELLAGDRLSTTEVAQIVSALRFEQRRSGGAK